MFRVDKASAGKVSDEIFNAVLYKKPQVILDLHSSGLLEKKAGEKALVNAAKYGSIEVAKALISCGISVSCTIETKPVFRERVTPLGMAAVYGQPDMVEMLLQNGAEVDQDTHVSLSISQSTPLQVVLLYRYQDQSNPRKVIELLLSHGADITKINENALYSFICNGKEDELELLLKAGLSPNVTVAGEPLLSLCFSHAQPKLAKKLIECGADVGYQKEGSSYLHRTCDAELTRVLVSRGLEVNARDKFDRTPIQCCTDRESVKIMMEAGASIESLTLHNRVVLSSVELTQKLLAENRANLNSLDKEGVTPLRHLAVGACLNGYLETLEYLLTHHVSDINVNQAGLGGWTALHTAFAENQGYVNFFDDKIEDEYVAKNQYTKAADLLIAHGAKPVKDKVGRTPLMCLTLNGFSMSYCSRVIERYYRFEAEYYQVDPEVYKKQLIELRRNGFDYVPTPGALGFLDCKTSIPRMSAIDQFWQTMEKFKVQTDAQSFKL